jgi:hypothetical protein
MKLMGSLFPQLWPRFHRLLLHIRVALDVGLNNVTHGQALDIDDSGSLDAEEFCNSIKNLVCN